MMILVVAAELRAQHSAQLPGRKKEPTARTIAAKLRDMGFADA
jgi:hypothetical protein